MVLIPMVSRRMLRSEREDSSGRAERYSRAGFIHLCLGFQYGTKVLKRTDVPGLHTIVYSLADISKVDNCFEAERFWYCHVSEKNANDSTQSYSSPRYRDYPVEVMKKRSFNVVCEA